jgi:hypothetical protein
MFMGMQVFSRLMASTVEWISSGFDSERAMGEYIKYNPGVLKMGSVIPAVLGFEIPCVKAGNKGKKTGKKDGRIDFLVDYDNFIAVVELKNGELTKSHLQQLLSYVHGKLPIEDSAAKNKRITKGVLVGTSADCELLVELKKEKKSEIAIVTLNRYKNESDGQLFDIVNTPFPFAIRDYTKYVIEGDPTPYPKSKIVYACVKDFLNKNPSSSYSLLEKKVDFKKTAVPALLKSEDLSGHPYEWAYVKAPFSVGDTSFVVRNWWDISEKEHYLQIARNLGCKLSEIKS